MRQRESRERLTVNGAIQIESLGEIVPSAAGAIEAPQCVRAVVPGLDDFYPNGSSPRVPVLAVPRLQISIAKQIVGIASHLREGDVIDDQFHVVRRAFDLKSSAEGIPRHADLGKKGVGYMRR